MASLKPLIFGEILRIDHILEKNEQLRATGFMNRLAMIKEMGFVPVLAQPHSIL